MDQRREQREAANGGLQEELEGMDGEEGELIYADEVLETISLSDDEETRQRILAEELEDMDIEGISEGDPKPDDACGLFKLHTGSVFAVAVNPLSTVAVSGGEDDRGYVWKLSNQELLFECTGHKDSVTCVGFSHDGKYVCTADMSGVIQVWLVDSGKLVWSNETSDIEWMMWHGHAHVLLVGTSEGTVWVWRLPAGDCKTLSSHGCKNTCGTILTDGKRVCCGYEDGSVRIWDLKTSKPIASHNSPTNKSSPVTCLASAGEPTLILSGHEDGSTKLFNDSLKLLAVLETTSSSSETSASRGVDDTDEEASQSIEAAAFVLSHQLIVTASLSGELCVWDLPTKKLRRTCLHPVGVTKFAVSSLSPTVFTGCLDGIVRSWDILSGSCVKEWHGHQVEILDITLTSDEILLLSSSGDQTVRTFNTCNN